MFILASPCVDSFTSLPLPTSRHRSFFDCKGRPFWRNDGVAVEVSRGRRIQEEEDYYRETRPFREYSPVDDYYFDDEDFRVEDSTAKPIQRPRGFMRFEEDNSLWLDDGTDEGVFEGTASFESEEEEEEEEEAPASGNFWFNPKPSLDLDRPVPTRTGPQRRRERFPQSTAPPHSRPSPRGQAPLRTTFRSGTPPPLAPVRDFYDRLFWYGFDPADSSSPADPTMFGGTKGKFNGLAYLQDGVGVMPADKLTRRPRYEEESYWEDGDERDDYDNEEPEASAPKTAAPEFSFRRTPVTPPYDPPRPMRSAPTRVPNPAKRSSRQPTRLDAGSRSNRNDWASQEVSSWFQSSQDDEDPMLDDEVEYGDSNRRQRRRSRSQSPWSLFGALETFLGMDRESSDPRAEEYDRQMGIGRRAPRPRSQPRRPERKVGYAYRYDDDDGTPVVEFEAVDGAAASADDSPEVKEVVVTDKGEKEQTAVPEMSWEERALAVERVPPVGIPAWGPEGDLGIDARTKAILDATEDLNLAKQRVEERRRNVEKAKEDIAILRVDAELERKRLENIKLESRVVHAKLRQVDLEIQDASRALRHAQNQLNVAQDELVALEQRHWAVLSFYNPIKVEVAVQDAIRELEDNEPAARLFREKREMAREQPNPNSSGSDTPI